MKTAIIHYWLVNMRGGEKVIEALLEMFPEADIFTHVYNPKKISALINGKRVFTSRVNRFPFAKKMYQIYMPFMPNALMDFNLQDYDLVISSESGPAKGVVPNPNAYHICYCHSPMRYLWDMYHDYYKKSNIFTRFFMKKLIPSLRLWDIASSNLADCFIANSSYVAKRIKRYYNRDSEIVYPPVDTEKFLSCERNPKDYYLFFGQNAGYKRLDLAREACKKTEKKLVIAGGGKTSHDELAKLYSGAKALLFPGIEDFGIVPLEAQAAGCPVIAYRGGGALETVKENETGIFFDEQTPDSLAEAILRFESMESVFKDRTAFNNHVARFTKETFKNNMLKIIQAKKRL